MDQNQARKKVWKELRKVAKPDSRFHWDFAEFIADYEGSDICADIIREQDFYKKAQVIFVTPDNNLEKLREYIIRDKKILLMTTYSIARGFVAIYPEDVPEGCEELASTLDGAERFLQYLTLQEMKERYEKVDFLVTGASAVTTSGKRFGKGHGFFDLEWAMMYKMDLISTDTLALAVGHDCQVVDLDIEPSEHDTLVDYIVTPSGITESTLDLPKPTVGVLWDKLQDGMLDSIPPLRELYEIEHKE